MIDDIRNTYSPSLWKYPRVPSTHTSLRYPRSDFFFFPCLTTFSACAESDEPRRSRRCLSLLLREIHESMKPFTSLIPSGRATPRAHSSFLCTLYVPSSLFSGFFHYLDLSISDRPRSPPPPPRLTRLLRRYPVESLFNCSEPSFSGRKQRPCFLYFHSDVQILKSNGVIRVGGFSLFRNFFIIVVVLDDAMKFS